MKQQNIDMWQLTIKKINQMDNKNNRRSKGEWKVITKLKKNKLVENEFTTHKK